MQGVASAAILSAGFSHVQQLYAGDSNALGHAMGTVTTGTISGVMAGPPLGGELYEVGKNVPFFFCAGVVGAAVLLAVVYDRGLRTTARREADVKGDQKGDVGGEAKVAGGGSSDRSGGRQQRQRGQQPHWRFAGNGYIPVRGVSSRMRGTGKLRANGAARWHCSGTERLSEAN